MGHTRDPKANIGRSPCERPWPTLQTIAHSLHYRQGPRVHTRDKLGRIWASTLAHMRACACACAGVCMHHACVCWESTWRCIVVLLYCQHLCRHQIADLLQPAMVCFGRLMRAVTGPTHHKPLKNWHQIGEIPVCIYASAHAPFLVALGWTCV